MWFCVIIFLSFGAARRDDAAHRTSCDALFRLVVKLVKKERKNTEAQLLISALSKKYLPDDSFQAQTLRFLTVSTQVEQPTMDPNIFAF